MNVAIVQETVDVRRGGAETSTLEMADCLAHLGHRVTVVHAGAKTSDKPLDDAGVRLHGIESRGASRVQRTLRFIRGAERFCRNADFDVVHAVTPMPRCDVYQPRGGLFGETIDRNLALVPNSSHRVLKRVGKAFNLRQQALLRIERRLLGGRLPPAVAAVSDYVRRQVWSHFPQYPHDRVRVVFNGVNIRPLDPDESAKHRTALRQTHGVAPDARLLLFVAHNFKLKGLRELLHALGEARESRCDWRLLIVGRDRSSRYAPLIASLGLRERVTLVGAADDLRTYYAAADALVHPTWYDPCSRVVLEALGHGLPVVTTRHNGASEIITAQQALGRTIGMVIDEPRDHAALRAAIGACVQPEVRAACRLATDALRETLSMTRHARELTALYEELLAHAI